MKKSESLENLASCSESADSFYPSTKRRSLSFSSLETLPTTEASSTGNNKVESKLPPPVFCISCSKLCSEPVPPPVFCSKCCLEHLPQPPPWFKFSDTCFRTHEYLGCPYERSSPQGAEFNRVKFTAACTLDGFPFDEEKWACIMGYGKKAKAAVKCCVYCMDIGNHCSYECPKGVVEAAKYKAYIDDVETTEASSNGNNKVEGKLVPSYIPQVPMKLFYAPQNPCF